MHDHTDNNGHKGMWWIMLPCLLLAGFLLLGEGRLSSSWYLWLIIIGACVVPHIWMMFKGHEGHEDNIDDDSPKQPETKGEADKHTHGECCH